MSSRVKKQFMICIDNASAPDLVLSKVYEALPDEAARQTKYVRVVDETGEDYLYPASCFRSIEIPASIRRAIRKNVQVSTAA